MFLKVSLFCGEQRPTSHSGAGLGLNRYHLTDGWYYPTKRQNPGGGGTSGVIPEIERNETSTSMRAQACLLPRASLTDKDS